MSKFLCKFKYFRELWSFRTLMLSSLLFVTWTLLGKSIREGNAGMFVFFAASVSVLISGIYCIHLGWALRLKPRMLDVSFAMQKDWMITKRIAWLMIIHLILLGIYGIWHSITFGLNSEFHWLASFSGTTFLFTLLCGKAPQSEADVCCEDIKRELTQQGYYNINGKLKGFQLIPGRSTLNISDDS